MKHETITKHKKMQNIKYLLSKYSYPAADPDKHVRPFCGQPIPGTADDACPEASVQPVPCAAL